VQPTILLAGVQNAAVVEQSFLYHDQLQARSQPMPPQSLLEQMPFFAQYVEELSMMKMT
jgi:hypothetical protein